MKCFYHGSDLDGHCSGAIVKYMHKDCEMIPINYGHDFLFDKIDPDEIVFMVDFCLQPFDLMLKLNNMCRLVWIDHHRTAIDNADMYRFEAAGLRREGIGACQLVWEYIWEYISEESLLLALPKAVRLLAEYDVWNHSDPETLPFQYGVRMVKDTSPNNMEFWGPLFMNNGTSMELISDIVKTGRTIIEYESNQNEKFCKAFAFETEIHIFDKKFKAIAINRGFTNSQIFKSVWNPEKYHMMVTFCRMQQDSNPLEKWTVSLYTDRDDVNVGDIAKLFGGGGHQGAAGFQCDELPFRY